MPNPHPESGSSESFKLGDLVITLSYRRWDRSVVGIVASEPYLGKSDRKKQVDVFVCDEGETLTLRRYVENVEIYIGTEEQKARFEQKY